jgi:hypothetical protein
MRTASTLVVAVAMLPSVARADDAEPADAPPRVRDNLFLLEEAYNQEPGVIQHIQVFQLAPRTRAWSYAFTDEWPVPDDRHQLSVTLPFSGGADTATWGIGDVMLNWRVQAAGVGGEGIVAFAPRLSLAFPSGDAAKGTGRGAWGLQVNLPVSVEAGPWAVVHLNAGVTTWIEAPAPDGSRSATLVDVNAGAALVVQPLHWLNPLVEVAWQNVTDLDASGQHRRHDLVINPGVRFAIDHEPSGLQVVPGLAAPLHVIPSDAFEASILLYLSFEHPAWRAEP